MLDARLGRLFVIAAVGLLAASVGAPMVGLESSAAAQTSVKLLPEQTLGDDGGSPADTDGRFVGARPDPRVSGSSRRSRSRSRTRRSRKRKSNEVTVPVDVGVGPAFFSLGNPLQGDQLLSGPIVEDQPFHYGLRFSMAAIIDYEFVRTHKGLVPTKYRSMFKPGSEVRYTPGILAIIPRDLIISPKTNNTGVYGATWQLLHVGIDLLKGSKSRLGVGAGLLATYAYIDSDAFASPTHFLRPGVSVGLDFGTMFNDSFGISAGWDSNFYIPQDIGGPILQAGEADASLWHIGEAFVMLHFRFPYTTTL